MPLEEVLTLGPLGPISKAAQEWLSRNVDQVMTLLETREAGVVDLVTKEEIKARVERLLKIRAEGLEREAGLKLARQERRRGEREGSSSDHRSDRAESGHT
jgi:hypothetical protein